MERGMDRGMERNGPEFLKFLADCFGGRFKIQFNPCAGTENNRE